MFTLPYLTEERTTRTTVSSTRPDPKVQRLHCSLDILFLVVRENEAYSEKVVVVVISLLLLLLLLLWAEEALER